MRCPECEHLELVQKDSQRKLKIAKAHSEELHASQIRNASDAMDATKRSNEFIEAQTDLAIRNRELAAHRATHRKSTLNPSTNF
jgi:hypothetical protein